MVTNSDQLDQQKRTVSYDMYDMSVRQLVDMVETNVIEIAPDYQRHFVWKDDRESELIESVFLGIPVPSLDRLVDERNAIAHGREAPDTIGAKYTTKDVDDIIEWLSTQNEYVIELFEKYYEDRKFISSSHVKRYVNRDAPK